MTIQEILQSNDPIKLKALFTFTVSDSTEAIVLKFNLWARKFFPKYFTSNDAPFHKQIDTGNVEAYKNGGQFLDIAFRGSAKTTRTKLFIAFVIANDTEHYRKFFKVLSEDSDNSKQSTTDVYNMLISRQVKALYSEVFERTEAKREETMASFTTATGVKMTSDTIGTSQRGDLQDESRPDFIWFDDFETRITLMSAVKTHKIWQNIDEALTGLAKGGAAVYTCNYLSERGNVHKLISKVKNQVVVPIEVNGIPTWDRYSKEDLKHLKSDVEDYEGDYLCKPSAAKDVYFDRERLNKMDVSQPVKEIGGLKIFKEYDPSHRYAGGHDVAGGVGLDSSASVFIDFDTLPAKVVATYASNEIQPEAFGDAIYEQANRFGGCLVAPENNKYDQAVLKAKQRGANLYRTRGKANKINFTPPLTYGWSTNSLTKNQMLSSLSKAIEDGLIDLSDQDLINECKSYTRNDLIDSEPDIRLTTRHFDLLMALAIAWQMKDHATVAFKPKTIDPIWQKKQENPAI